MGYISATPHNCPSPLTSVSLSAQVSPASLGLTNHNKAGRCTGALHPTVSCLPSDFFTALFADFSSRSLFLFCFPGCPINLDDVFLHVCTLTHVLTSTWSNLLLHLNTQKSAGLTPQGLTPEPTPYFSTFNQDTGFYILLHVELASGPS